MNELTITFDTSGKHLYEQIYNYIKNEISKGNFSAGEKLPSSRALAEHLQVSRSTIDQAYGQLLGEGYIEARPYKGYFVCALDESLAWKNAEHGKPVFFGTEQNRKIEQNRKTALTYDIDFSPNAIDMRYFPFGTWRKISKNVLWADNSELFLMGHSQGDSAFRSAIAKYLYQARGVECAPEQIVIGAGNDYLLLLLHRMLGEQVEIAMENPTYLKAYRMFHSFSYRIHTIPMDENGMRADALEASGADIAYVMPSHQFPVGTLMPIKRRLELLKWAGKAAGRYLIEDDYDSEFRFKGKPVPALLASDQTGKVIYLGSFSKSIAPAVRISFLVLPKHMLPLYQRTCGMMGSTVPRVDQSIVEEFMTSGAFERYLNKMRKCYREKHDMLLTLLEPFAEYFEISGVDAGLHLLLISKSGLPEEILLKKAEHVGIRVYGMSEYGREEGIAGKSAVLLGFGGLTEQEIEKGITRLKEAWLPEI